MNPEIMNKTSQGTPKWKNTKPNSRKDGEIK